MFARRRGPSYDPNDELDEPTTSRPSLAGIPMLESAGNGDEAAQEKAEKIFSAQTNVRKTRELM